MSWSDLQPKPNVLILITDQQREARHWPAGWAAENLTSLEALKRHGMTFENAFCSACECSPSRASFVTSTYPQVNGMTRTPPNITLSPTLPNLATVMREGGYDVAWKGKWHLFESSDAAGDLDAYGFASWDPPDAGTTLDTKNLGGGTPGTPSHNGNDARYVSAGDGAIEYLREWQARPVIDRKPFCLVVSLANPHDVHVYVQGYGSVGYPDDFQSLPVGLPGNYADSLRNKPRAQLAVRELLDNVILPFNRRKGCLPALLGGLGWSHGGNEGALTPEGYTKFYAWLNRLADGEMAKVAGALDELGLTESTLVVRCADHGEMGMSHGLREKVYNAYEETIHVPLVFSNPVAFPEPVSTPALASLVDLLPTLAAIAGVPAPDGIAGVDLTPVLAGEAASVQDGIVWAYDDFAGVFPLIANKLRALRTERWTYVVYFSPLDAPFEFELYDLEADPDQMHNLLNPLKVSMELWEELHGQLTDLARQKGTLPPQWPKPDPSLLTVPPLPTPLAAGVVGWDPVLNGK
ncbi:MAG TPA: sulfatase-like hydrolase/transferase [Longimicrobium sp.]|nr:sulfatase-like hydrolase/transferase [Longimicrobium sp.]